MATSGSIIALLLLLSAGAWIIALQRFPEKTAAIQAVQRGHSFPILYLILGIVLFALPIFEYWLTARSHPNALAGFLPWADATEYFFCAQAFLLNLPGADHCGKRPLYVAYFADLLWLTGNRMQLALLLQAIILAGACLLFARRLAHDLSVQAALAAFAVLFLYATAFCIGLVMTENLGTLFGVLAFLLLWTSARDSVSAPMFVIGIALLAAAVTVRPGPIFILPALFAWLWFYSNSSRVRRFILLGLATALIFCAASLSAVPALIAGKSLGETHSNFSYVIYGLVAGGKGWLQVTLDHPDVFKLGLNSKEVTNRVYGLAWESLISKPHLAVYGYLKGLAVYFDDLFRFATEYKPLRHPLRFIFLMLPWFLGVWYALQRWREPRYAMLIWMQAGVLVSAPFLVIDGYNRVFASTIALDAIFVALGFVWLGERLAISSEKTEASSRHRASENGALLTGSALAALGTAALMVPVLLPLAYRGAPLEVALRAPDCPAGQESVTVRPGRGTLALPLVEAGKERVWPLAVRSDHFAGRFDRWVVKREALGQPAGTQLFWGTRIDGEKAGRGIYIKWGGEVPVAGDLVRFCVDGKARLSGFLMSAVSMRKIASGP